MAKRNNARRRFTDAVKVNTVRRIKNGSSVPKEAERVGCSTSMVYAWVKDERYASPGDANVLPTKSAPPKKTKAKAIVATAFECPHCGGALEVAA